MDDIPKSAAWILSGSSVAAAMVTLVGLAPRLAGAYPKTLVAAIILIVLGLVCGCAAAIVHLVGANRGTAAAQGDTPGQAGSAFGSHRGIAIGSIAMGMVLILLGTAVIAVTYALTLSTRDVPRLTLSVADAEQPGLATVKVKFEADGLNPGQFIVVDLIALHRDTVIPVGVEQIVPDGHRIYRAAIGSDSKGQVTSEIQTNVHRKDFGIVVAQVWPGPLDTNSLASNNLRAGTSLCGDIIKKESRSCAYAEIPA
jgi:hypothetical protein